MRIRVVIVEPRYQINLGYSARVAMNFGLDKLYIVNPKCNYKGYRAIMYSKHAHQLLENAEVCSSIARATRGTLCIGTTGLWRKSKSGMYNVYKPAAFARMLKQSRAKDLSLLIGREGPGLTSQELSECDATIYVPAYNNYSVLNTSHALAILLYILTQHRFADNEPNWIYASQKQKTALIKQIRRYLKAKSSVRDVSGVTNALAHVINRSMPSSSELRSISAAFSMNKPSAKHSKR